MRIPLCSSRFLLLYLDMNNELIDKQNDTSDLALVSAEEVYTDAQRASDEREDEQSNMAAEQEDYELHGSD